MAHEIRIQNSVDICQKIFAQEGTFKSSEQYIYRIVASTNTCYYSENQFFVQRSQYIGTENPLHKPSEKAKTCHYPRRASTRDYTVNQSICKLLVVSHL